MGDQNDMKELLELYGTEDLIEAAAREKDEAEESIEDVGRLVKDYPKVQRELDLHGMSGAEAVSELENFIKRCIHARVLTIRVITGKGLHSKNFKSVLPEMTERKLGELRRAGSILTFKRDKSGGAFMVYLVS